MTHKDFKAMELYNQINALEENNLNGRYDKRIKGLRRELETLLKELETETKNF